ncbi:MAG: hypothetical protein KBG48_27375 [Kofleriaceae bacterium]|jgi:hypothetical protein|nr:hypothetical protein [Kofleriaceae bacterium]MBP9171151.1 hypothetical protein [Kofleriaceae bacterium]MBP9861912.1 hypothetical protein [Kofleriaceae bacterium]
MRGLALALLALAACSDEVSGELRLARPITTATATATVVLWEYDRDVADTSADAIARFVVAPVTQGVQAVPFTLEPADADSGLAHYVTAEVDQDSDGLSEVGDFVVDDFHAVDLGQRDVIIPLVPRADR